MQWDGTRPAGKLGFSTFTFTVTAVLHWAGDNLAAVSLDKHNNMLLPDYMPRDHWFPQP